MAKAAVVLTEEQKTAKKAEREAAKVSSFKKLANARVSKALDAIAVIANLANKNTYTYTPEQVVAIDAALNHACKTVIAKFGSTETVAAGGFDIDAAAAPAQSDPIAQG